jgi:hypothetical protein
MISHQIIHNYFIDDKAMNELHKVLAIYAINNFSYSTGRFILQNTNYFSLISDPVNDSRKKYYKLDEESMSEVLYAIRLLHFAYSFNSDLKYTKIKLFNDTHNQRLFLLNETKSLLGFISGDIDSAFSLLRNNLNWNYKKSSTYKLLSIINAAMNNDFNAKYNVLEYSSLVNEKTMISGPKYKKERDFINDLIEKNNKPIAIDIPIKPFIKSQQEITA